MSEETGLGIGRRGVLSRVGAGCLAAAGGGLLLPDPPWSPDPADDETVHEERPEVDESAVPYAVWQHKYENGEYEPTAPINVVFPLQTATFREVIDVFRDANWYGYPEEYARYAWDRDDEAFVLQQWTGAETYFGKVGRHHVRCWQTDGTASIQAHVDTAATPKHGIVSYAEGRTAVEDLFSAAGWSVDAERLSLGNESDPDHDGRASVIRGVE